MNWESFKNQFHKSWHNRMKPFIESKECDKIYAFLKSESQKGKKIAPSSNNTFRIFSSLPLEEVKAVILYKEPYCEFENGTPIATGVALDCSITKKAHPLLKAFFSGIEKDVFNGLNLEYIEDYSLDYLIKQGIMFLNVSLTVEKDKPGSHIKLWDDFINHTLDILKSTGVPILFIGDEPKRFKPLMEKTNYCYITDNLDKKNQIGNTWNPNGVFVNISKNVWDSNNDSILWLNIETPF